MQWLSVVMFGEAAIGFVLSGLNTAWLLELACGSGSGRRAGSLALAFVCSVLACEALLFLLQPTALPGSLTWTVFGLLFVRSALLVASALISALILRSVCRR